MKNRTELAKYFAQLGFKRGAEIGVGSGIFSKRMLEIIPNLNLLCVDSWRRRKRHKDFYEARKVLMPYSGATVIWAFSVDAAKLIPHEWLDFVYIDADHTYERVKDDILQWAKRVRKGGIVSGHDYFDAKHINLGVIKAVDEYVKKIGYELNVTEWDLETPEKDERQPSWWFIKT